MQTAAESNLAETSGEREVQDNTQHFDDKYQLEYKMKPANQFIFITLFSLLVSTECFGQSTENESPFDLSKLAATEGWAVFNRDVGKHSEPGYENAVYINAKRGQGIAWFPGVKVGDAVIEVDLKGRDSVGPSFVGVAFCGQGAEQYEVVYLRPYNFRNDDPERRSRAIQYMSVPSHEWQRLRRHHPGQYEAAVDPELDPNGWIHVRIVVSGGSVEVFLNESKGATLTVDRIGSANDGWVGLWVGNRSDGTFANLKVKAKEVDNEVSK